MAALADDPFDWEIDRLIEELYRQDRPWFPAKNPKKFPPRQDFATALRENDVDGELLLTVKDPQYRDLWKDLGVDRPQYRLHLHRAIEFLRRRSPKYKRFTQEPEGEEEAGGDEPQLDTPVPTEFSFSNDAPKEVDLPGQHEVVTPSYVDEIRHEGPKKVEPVAEPSNTDLQTSGIRTKDDLANIIKNQQNGTAEAGPLSPLNQLTATKRTAEGTLKEADEVRDSGNEVAGAGEPVSKKRRVVPFVVTGSVVLKPNRHTVPTEADIFGRFDSVSQNARHKDEVETWKHQYLGPRALKWQQMLQLDTTEEFRSLDKVDMEFSFILTGQPPAHQQRVGNAMKRLLRHDGPQLRRMISTFESPPDPESLLHLLVDEAYPQGGYGASETSDDRVLAPYGEEDDDYWDPEMEREIEEERHEEEERRARMPKTLSAEDVARALDHSIAEIAVKWKEQKLPILERKAYATWRKARRHGTRRIQLVRAGDHIELAKRQIDQGRKEIEQLRWSSAADIGRQALALEQSVINLEHETWLFEILNGPMPPKPESLPRLKFPPRRMENRQALEDDEEILTSSSELEGDDVGGFVVEDDDVATDMLSTPEPISPPQRVKSKVRPAVGNPRDFIDLTLDDDEAVQTRTKANDSREAAGLVTPPRQPSLPSLEFKKPPKFDGRMPPRAVLERFLPLELDVRKRLMICLLWQAGKKQRDALFEAMNEAKEFPGEFLQHYIMEGIKLPPDGKPESVANLAMRLLASYSVKYAVKPNTKLLQKIESNPKNADQHTTHFSDFFDFILDAIPLFPETSDDVFTEAALTLGLLGGDEAESESENEAEESRASGKSRPSKKRRAIRSGQAVILNEDAKELREGVKRRMEEQDKRRQVLHAQLAQYKSVSGHQSRLIVNETKEESDGFVYITGEPARLIKNHQIDGVRFLWNHLVAGSVDTPQGCVLAHTMGLGKTMQVITFLMAVVQAANSQDATVAKQIPKHLRKSRTLILCPPTLMLNWQDEILQWDSQRILGEVRLVGSNPRQDAPDARVARITHIEDWSREGGILIMGYKLLPKLLEELGIEHCAMLQQKPNIVVVDEAHNIKNIKSKVRIACTQFKTRSRIALTGSPLSNNVTEYYSMIDWVAPQYMGPHKEFQAIYALPIETGLWKDCEPSQTRKAYMMLQVLRKTISPKVHRATIQALRGEFPDKKEFVLTIPVTPLQRKVYNNYVDLLHGNTTMSTSMTFGALDNLQLILTHPRIFYQRCEEAIGGTIVEDRQKRPIWPLMTTRARRLIGQRRFRSSGPSSCGT